MSVILLSYFDVVVMHLQCRQRRRCFRWVFYVSVSNIIWLTSKTANLTILLWSLSNFSRVQNDKMMSTRLLLMTRWVTWIFSGNNQNNRAWRRRSKPTWRQLDSEKPAQAFDFSPTKSNVPRISIKISNTEIKCVDNKLSVLRCNHWW